MRADSSCVLAFFGRPVGSLKKTTSAGPDGSTVLPGQTITVTLSWNPHETGETPAKVEDCVSIGPRLSAVMSQAQRLGPGGGSATFSYVIPTGGTNGRQVCDRGLAWVGGPRWGRFGGGRVERSNVVCYTILAAATPEAPAALLLPVAGIVVGGGGYLVVRRRRRPQGLGAHGGGVVVDSSSNPEV